MVSDNTNDKRQPSNKHERALNKFDILGDDEGVTQNELIINHYISTAAEKKQSHYKQQRAAWAPLNSTE